MVFHQNISVAMFRAEQKVHAVCKSINSPIPDWPSLALNNVAQIVLLGPCKGGYPCPQSEFQSFVCHYFGRFPCHRNFDKTSIACRHFVGLVSLFQGRVTSRNLPLTGPFYSHLDAPLPTGISWTHEAHFNQPPKTSGCLHHKWHKKCCLEVSRDTQFSCHPSQDDCRTCKNIIL